MTDHDQAVVMIYESVKQRLPINFSQFRDALKDWEFLPLKENGKVIGAIGVSGAPAGSFDATVARAGAAAASKRSSPAAAANSPFRLPKINRPVRSRETKR